MSVDAKFVKSVYRHDQLPLPEYPEIAFAGRSNVGKSSLINKLIGRKNLVKVSSKPGKTQSLNFFFINNAYYLVDLPGYGYARVPMKMRQMWQGLISTYFETRSVLRCVVVIIDIRHNLKMQDRDLMEWLKSNKTPCLPVYTKIDKLSRQQRRKNAQLLDSGLGVAKEDRVLFSAKTGEGRENLISKLDQFLA